MLILSIETSGKNGGVALVRGDSSASELLGESTIGAGQYSAELMPRIVELLRATGATRYDVDGFAVASGPGSFTGLRVGIATAKALADTLQKPLAAVSVLEAVAAGARELQRKLATEDPDAQERNLECEHIVGLLDAGRGEVYVGVYAAAIESAPIRVVREFITSLADLQGNFARLAPEPILIATPDAQIAEKLRDLEISVLAIERPAARDVARLGLEKLLRGEAAPVAEFDANYIRRSDAELFSLPKLHAR